MSAAPIHVVKYSGESVPFQEDKLRQSLMDAGASPDIAQKITHKISSKLYDGISTREIYQKAHLQLRNREKAKALRYGLKKAILQLGPSGYPFEMYVAELMRHEGFVAQVGNIMPGQCVNHEVDVYAVNQHEVRMIECKFHNRPGYKTDVKVALYIKSRFDDLNSEWAGKPELQSKNRSGWLVTNSRFTSDAINYGRCAGLRLVSWDYPDGNSLKDLVNKHRLYPVTALSGLSKSSKETLMTAGVVLANTLCESPESLKTFGIEKSKIDQVVEEARLICEL